MHWPHFIRLLKIVLPRQKLYKPHIIIDCNEMQQLTSHNISNLVRREMASSISVDSLDEIIQLFVWEVKMGTHDGIEIDTPQKFLWSWRNDGWHVHLFEGDSRLPLLALLGDSEWMPN